MSDAHATEAPVRVLEALDGGRIRPRRGLARRLTLGLGRIDPNQPGITEARAPAPVLGREGTYRRALALFDMGSATGALLTVLLIAGDHTFEPALLGFAPLLVLVNKLSGLYDRDDLVLNKTTLDEAPALLQIGGLFTLIVWLVHAPLLTITLEPLDVLVLWVAVTLALVLGRATARRLAARVSAPERCMLVGAPGTMRAIEDKLAARRIHATVAAKVPLSEGSGVASLLEELPAMIRRADAHRIVLAPEANDGGATLDFIRVAKASGARVSVLPRLLEVVGSSVTVDQIDGLTMLGIRSFGLTRSSKVIKRAFDLAGAGLLLLAVAPAMALVAAGIKAGSRGPVFFRQTRVGRNGRRFQIYKFRSMIEDAEERKGELLHLNETHGLFKMSADPRVTAVGRLLRASSLDELPQLINVVRGEMSLVGPRPLVVDEDAKVAGLDRSRLHLTPGMTGHWQILGSARIPLGEMVGIDYLYVANWSLWTDVKILLRTVPYVLSRGGM
jgi:exopolysaccharide biosynthesis polyprenyl glycosylphosphotransferase